MRVVIVEDHVLLREGLKRIFAANDIEVAAALADAEQLTSVIQSEAVDLAILDVRLPPTFTNEGLVAGIALRRRWPGFPVMVLSQYVQQLYARELFQDGQGAIGYLLKDRVTDVPRFVRIVRDVAAGGTSLDPKVVSAMVARVSPDGPIKRLTPREREVLALMAEGRSNAGVAEALVVTQNAVGKHIHNIFGKLGLREATDANRRVLAVLEYLKPAP